MFSTGFYVLTTNTSPLDPVIIISSSKDFEYDAFKIGVRSVLVSPNNRYQRILNVFWEQRSFLLFVYYIMHFHFQAVNNRSLFLIVVHVF